MSSSASRRTLAAACAAALLGTAFLAPAFAQDPSSRLAQSETRLEAIRLERQRLRQDLAGIAGQFATDSAQLVNIERQIAASSSLIAEFDVQLGVLGNLLSDMTRDILLTRDRLTANRAVLNERLRHIYKRGPLETIEALLASRSFSDLLNRYKYLREVAVFDRMLVNQVAELEVRLADQRSSLGRETERVKRIRAENLREYQELGRLEQQRQERLQAFSGRRAEARSTLTRLAAEEQELRNLIADLEARRRSAEIEAGPVTVSAFTTSDLGNLPWPVRGEILWQFGPDSDGRTTIPREGIGIGAARGAPVRTVHGGAVVSVAARTYGQTVIIDHGGGYYSSYQKLQGVVVGEGQRVEMQQVIGNVGGDAANPHIEFHIYEPGTPGPRAVDPLRWMRSRRDPGGGGS